jgi:hypothetical protein
MPQARWHQLPVPAFTVYSPSLQLLRPDRRLLHDRLRLLLAHLQRQRPDLSIDSTGANTRANDRGAGTVAGPLSFSGSCVARERSIASIPNKASRNPTGSGGIACYPLPFALTRFSPRPRWVGQSSPLNPEIR